VCIRVLAKKLYIFLLFSLFLAGCSTLPYPPERVSISGVYHEVRRGESIWKISKIYGVDLNRIIRANHLPNASKIEVGQLIFIPDKKNALTTASYPKYTKSESFIWPVKGKVVSYFGSAKNMVKNKGIDIESRPASSIVASRSGRVSFVSDYLEGYGKTIIVDHQEGFQTVYAHNSKNLIKLNQEVNQGDVIAKIGTTGRAKKPTLHFEIRKKHKPRNPFYYLP